jgi:glycosyltransferase involved in cell wall biosynthesis
MRIFLVSIGEPLPTDQGSAKLFRTGVLFEYLIKLNHEVTWWTSTFNHSIKKQRSTGDKVEHFGKNGKIIQLHGPSYNKNVTIWRFLNHTVLGFKLNRLLKKEKKPDVFVISYPAIELAFCASFFARRNSIPYIVDVRDLWPDIIHSHFKNPLLRRLVYMGLYHLKMMAHYIFGNADSITGVTDKIVNWAQGFAPGRKCENDKSFPLTSKIRIKEEKALDEAYLYWRSIVPNEDAFIICFFGIISDRKFDIDSIIKASHLLKEGDYSVKFILCGLGDDYSKYQNLDDSDIILTGWIDAPKILSLLKRSKVGVAPYRSSEDFKISVPIKIFEYMSEGLPIVSCLQGVVQDLINDNKIGLTYNERDPHSLFDALVTLIENEDIRKDCSQRAKVLYQTNYDETAIFNGMVANINAIGKRAIP